MPTLPANTDRRDGPAFQEPRTLWEAMGRLAQVREQHDFARRTGDHKRLAELAALHLLLWARVRAFVAPLVERGEAPPEMVERLQASLQVPALRTPLTPSPSLAPEQRRAA